VSPFPADAIVAPIKKKMENLDLLGQAPIPFPVDYEYKNELIRSCFGIVQHVCINISFFLNKIFIHITSSTLHFVTNVNLNERNKLNVT